MATQYPGWRRTVGPEVVSTLSGVGVDTAYENWYILKKRFGEAPLWRDTTNEGILAYSS